MEKKIQIKTEEDLKMFLYKNYMTQIQNFFGEKKQAMRFLSSVMSAVQKTPKLLECEAPTVINSFMTMAQLQLMPSDISGEAYVLPYGGKAQFQLGYQGLITLFYRAGGQKIRTEIVRQKDVFKYKNGNVEHEIDIMKSNEERGEPVGAYAIAEINGKEIAKVMNSKDILGMGQKFSKSWNTDFTPWKIKNDPELWMWKKTVLKQLAKMLPKNESINIAINEDNKDSIISDRIKKVDTESLKLKSVLKEPKKDEKKDKEEKEDFVKDVNDLMEE